MKQVLKCITVGALASGMVLSLFGMVMDLPFFGPAGIAWACLVSIGVIGTAIDWMIA